jgi:hypothetical protein
MTGKRLVLEPKPIEYELMDNFDDSALVAAVDGSRATPLQGALGSLLLNTRLVTDTGNNLSVGGGVLYCAGAVAIDDPIISYGAIARVSGQVVLWKCTVSIIVTNGVFMGLFNATPPQKGGPDDTEEIFWYVAGGKLYINDKNMTPLMYSPSLSNEYGYAIVLRDNGAMYFIRVGGQWLYLGGSVVNTNSPLYFAISNVDAVFTVDDVRVPTELWLPLALAADSFNRADGVLGVTDGMGIVKAIGGANKTWTSQIGTWGISTLLANCSVLVGGVGIATVFLTTADIIIKCIPTWIAGQVGLVFRYTDANNYAYAYVDGTNASVREVVAGVDSVVIAAIAVTYVFDHVLFISLQGTAVRILYDGVSMGTGTLNALLTSTVCGMYSTNVGNLIDNFVVFAKGTGDEYEKLNEFARGYPYVELP